MPYILLDPVNAEVVIPPVGEGLKTSTVQPLPLTLTVPQMYNVTFFYNTFNREHVVIESLRSDVTTLYTYTSQLAEASNEHSELLIAINAALLDLEARVLALENA